MMTNVIEYCLCNVDDEQRDHLQNLDCVREYTCLEHCGICCDEAFLVVDRTVVRGEDHEQLISIHAANGGGGTV